MGIINSTLRESPRLVRAVESPLDIPHILENVFEYLNTRDLLNVRQVCTSWNEIALALMKDKTKVTLTADNHYKIQKFLNCFLKSRSFPISRGNIESHFKWSLEFPIYVPYLLCELLEVYSPFIEDFGVDTQLLEVFPIYDPETFNFLNLKFLRIKETVSSHIDIKKVGENFKNIVSSAPKLAALKITPDADTTCFIREPNNWMQVMLMEFENLPSLKTLKNLDIQLWTPNILPIAVTAFGNLTLETLIIELHWKQFSPEDFVLLLATQSRTLKHLEITESHHEELDTSLALIFPSMPYLKSLYIRKRFQRRRNQGFLSMFTDISYVKQFPALDKLNLDFFPSFAGEEDIFEELLTKYLQPSQTIEELILPNRSEFNLKNILAKIPHLFPKVKKLKLSSIVILPNIMAELKMIPGLEQLRITLLYEGREHKQSCFLCNITKPYFADFVLGKFIYDESGNGVPLLVDDNDTSLISIDGQLEWQIVAKHLESISKLTTVQFTCYTDTRYYSNQRKVELFAKKDLSGDFQAFIKTRNGRKNYWAELK